MDSDHDPESPTPSDNMADGPMSTFQPYIRPPSEVKEEDEENENEHKDGFNTSEEEQEEDSEESETEEFPPPPSEPMTLEENETEDESSEYESEEPNEKTEEENEPETMREDDSTPLVNEEDVPSHVVAVTADDEVEMNDVSEPQPLPEPELQPDSVEEDENHTGQPLTHVPSMRARYVQRDIAIGDDNDKLRCDQLCCTCVCLVILASVVVFLVSVFLFPSLEPVGSTIAVSDEGLVLAEVMVTLDRNFNDSLYDPSSEEYQNLSTEYIIWVRQIMAETTFAGNAYGAFVNGFRPGSVIVYSSVFFDLSTNTVGNFRSDLESELNNPALLEQTTYILPVTMVAVGSVSRSSEDTKIPIENIRSPRPRPPVSTTTPSSNTSSDLGNMTASSPPLSPGTLMTDEAMDSGTPYESTEGTPSNSTLVRGTPSVTTPYSMNSTSAITSRSNVTNGPTAPIATT